MTGGWLEHSSSAVNFLDVFLTSLHLLLLLHHVDSSLRAQSLSEFIVQVPCCGPIKARVSLLPKSTNPNQSYKTYDSRDSSRSRADTSTSTGPCKLASLLSVTCSVILLWFHDQVPRPLNVSKQRQSRYHIKPKVERVEVVLLADSV